MCVCVCVCVCARASRARAHERTTPGKGSVMWGNQLIWWLWWTFDTAGCVFPANLCMLAPARHCTHYWAGARLFIIEHVGNGLYLGVASSLPSTFPCELSIQCPLSKRKRPEIYVNVNISSVQLLSRVWLFVTTWIIACQPSLSITNSRSPPKLISIESVMPSSHLILCHPLRLLPPISPSIRVFSNESTLCMRWPKY